LAWLEIDGRQSNAYSLESAIGGTWVSLETLSIEKVGIRLGLRPKTSPAMNVSAIAGSTVEIELPEAHIAVHDWQHCAREVSHSGTTLRLATTSRPGTYHVGIECGDAPVIVPARVTLTTDGPSVEPAQIYTGPRPRMPIALAGFRNAGTVAARSHWRGFDNRYHLQLDALKTVEGFLETQWADFEIPDRDPRFVRIEYGTCGKYDRILVRSTYPSRAEIPINRATPCIALLFASEFEARMTWAEVGHLELQYDRGTSSRTPLVIGKNFESLTGHFATDLNTVDLPEIDHINVLVLKADASRTIERLAIQVDTADTYMALLGVSVC
jgi:hypothetical protein